VVVTGTGRKQFFVEIFFEIFFRKIANPTETYYRAAMPDISFPAPNDPDALKWALAFMALNPDSGMSVDLMHCWFANAMMAMHDYMTGEGPVILPDGSAFFAE
jgi:hypothetical protein